MTIKTFRGKLPIGVQEKIHLSTHDGLTGYRINKFQVINAAPGTIDSQTLAKIYLTDQSNSIVTTVDFSESDLLAIVYQKTGNSGGDPVDNIIIFDKEVFNQDIFVYVTDAVGNTTPVNFYIELEQIKLNLNESTYTTVKNIRSRTQA